MPVWTSEQKEAIEKSGSNIIVSAGAGSGKTAVLSERVIRKLKDGVDIRNILMLTFTNEAAGEMASRIRKKIKAAGLYNQLEYLDQAYITTFDAFALGIVKKYHYVLNMGKDINVIVSSIIDLKRKDFLEEIFLEMYEEKDSDFLSLVGDFTTRDDEIIKEAILNINKSLDLKYDKKEFMVAYILNYYSDEYIDKVFNEYFNYIKCLCDELENLFFSIEPFMDSTSYEKIYHEVSKFFRPNNYNDLYKYHDITLPKFTKLDEEGKGLKENIQNTFKEIKELICYSEDELKDLETKVANKEIPEKKMADTNNIIARLKKDIEVFSEYKGNENGIVSLILICPIINNQMWTLYIGNNSLATYTFAVNRSYYEAMKIASEKNCEFLDLFGTCGDPGTKEKNYNGIHEYKRKMGGTYTEFVGEYDIVNKPFINKMLPIMLKIYRKLRRK